MDRSLIFTTDIPSPDRLRTLTPQLNAILGHGNWIIDLEDGEATGADKGCARSFPAKLENGRIYLDMGVAAPA